MPLGIVILFGEGERDDSVTLSKKYFVVHHENMLITKCHQNTCLNFVCQ